MEEREEEDEEGEGEEEEGKRQEGDEREEWFILSGADGFVWLQTHYSEVLASAKPR